MAIIDKVKSGKKKPFSDKSEKGCIKLTEEERDNLKSMIRERKNENQDYYYFFFFFILLLIIATIILIAI